MSSRPDTVLCVDDNPYVADAIRTKISRQDSLEWLGWLPSATDLPERVRSDCPSVVLIDLDMPGADPLEVMAQISRECPQTKVIVFSGHVGVELVERAIESGAWGYVSKNDGEESLVTAVCEVLAGEFYLSPQVRAMLEI